MNGVTTTLIDMRGQLTTNEDFVARILVMEDELALALAWSELLHDAGHEVEVARNASEAIEFVTDRAFDLLIADLYIRDESGAPMADGGLRLIGTIKAKQSLREYNALRNMPIIAVSGAPKVAAGASPLQMAKTVGAHVILQKPVAWETLVANVAVLLARAKRGDL